MAWLGGWAKRVKLTIDKDDIDAALSDFPILVYLSANSGRNNADVSAIFDELLSDDNRKKIAVTTSDGQTQCYVEIEKWDDANEKAWLWVKVPSVASGADTILYLYYDKDHADNDTYVGDTNSTPAENAWDEHFLMVYHMRDNPDSSHVRDSTGNNRDGTKKDADEPLEVEGQVGKAQGYDGVNDAIQTVAFVIPNVDNTLTIEARIKCSYNADIHQTILSDTQAGGAGVAHVWFLRNKLSYRLMLTYSTGAVFSQIYSPNTFFTGYDDVWVRAAVVADYVNKWAKFYRDSSLFYTGTTEDNMMYPDANKIKYVGTYMAAFHPFKDLIDELRLSNTARSATWIKASDESEIDDLLAFGSEEIWGRVLKIVAITSQYRGLKIITAQNRLVKVITAMYRKVKSFTGG